MEKGSMSSSMKAAIASKSSPTTTISDDHEGGSTWTYYLRDFPDYPNGEDSSSLVSDAAWNQTHHGNHVVEGSSSFGAPPYLLRKGLNLKKTRIHKICDDDEEDTASSPNNSPQVSPFGHLDWNSRREYDHLTKKQGAPENNKNPSLRERGLCVVPISIGINYINS